MTLWNDCAFCVLILSVPECAADELISHANANLELWEDSFRSRMVYRPRERQMLNVECSSFFYENILISSLAADDDYATWCKPRAMRILCSCGARGNDAMTQIWIIRFRLPNSFDLHSITSLHYRGLIWPRSFPPLNFIISSNDRFSASLGKKMETIFQRT